MDIRFNQKVASARHVNDQWNIQTHDNLYHAINLVIAAGFTQEPVLPTWPGQDLFKGPVLHSSQYKNGEPFKGKSVLVVGFGNSGGEIAIDLWDHGARVSLAVRSAVNVIPRELFAIPVLSIGILLSQLPPEIADVINAPILDFNIGDITKYGLRKLSYGPLTQIQLSSGYETRIPGLYFCGYYVAPTGMLREIGLEAKRISAAMRQGNFLLNSDLVCTIHKFVYWAVQCWGKYL